MASPPYVLVVDDERDLVRLLEFNLQQAGFETGSAYTGEEALQKARQRVPDLVVLDLMLPDVSGTEVCRQLKASPRTHTVPVLMLTALEFKLLATFMSRVGRLQTRGTLLRDVWGVSGELQTRTVDTHVKRLREKLGSGRDLIETVRGIGYRMSEPEPG